MGVVCGTGVGCGMGVAGNAPTVVPPHPNGGIATWGNGILCGGVVDSVNLENSTQIYFGKSGCPGF